MSGPTTTASISDQPRDARVRAVADAALASEALASEALASEALASVGPSGAETG